MGKHSTLYRPNWYWDAGWSKKRVVELLRRNFKARWRAKNARRITWHNKRGLPVDRPVPSEIKLLVRDRWALKMQGDYPAADRLRDQLESLGFALTDTKSGSLIRWRRNLSTQAAGG